MSATDTEIVAAFAGDTLDVAMPLGDWCVGAVAGAYWITLGHLTRKAARRALARGIRAYGDDPPPSPWPEPAHQFAEITAAIDGGWWAWLDVQRYGEHGGVVLPVTVFNMGG